MATFTVELWKVMQIEQDTGNGLRIGLDAYPIFDPSHRDVLNRKIIAHFWNREIGQETISMWKFALARRMNEIMPYWNQVYLSTLIEFDPLATFNLKTIRDDKATEKSGRSITNTTKTANASNSKTVSSNTPQNELPDDWVENADYASSGAVTGSKTDITADTDTSDSGTGETETEGTSTTTGFQGSAADLLAKYRDVLINTDMMVIGQLTDLFMLIWDSGDEILPNPYNAIGWY